MKIGIMSDIHSNIYAFKAAAEYLENLKCDEYIFLGDYISDTPYTREALDFLYKFIESHKCTLLRGNREDYFIDQRRFIKEDNKEKIWINNSASGNLLYSYEQINDSDIDFLESLPISFIYKKEGYPDIICAHGSPSSSRELLQFDGDNTKEWLSKIEEDYLLCAHTHYPGELVIGNKHYFNSGCIGIAIGDFGYAQCMSIEGEYGKQNWDAAFYKVPYDNTKVAKDMMECGLLERAPWFINANIETILTGADKAAHMVHRAIELSKKAGETYTWPLIDDKYFEIAARELKIPDYR